MIFFSRKSCVQSQIAELQISARAADDLAGKVRRQLMLLEGLHSSLRGPALSALEARLGVALFAAAERFYG